MIYSCTKCSMERGATSMLTENSDGIYVCRLNPAHRFRLDGDGFLTPVQ